MSRRRRRSCRAFRKPRYVIQKVVDGVSSDWHWYTLFGALQRRLRAGHVGQHTQSSDVELFDEPSDLRMATVVLVEYGDPLRAA